MSQLYTKCICQPRLASLRVSNGNVIEEKKYYFPTKIRILRCNIILIVAKHGNLLIIVDLFYLAYLPKEGPEWKSVIIKKIDHTTEARIG